MKNKYHGTVFIMKPWKEKAQSVMILRGEFVKTTTQFHCLFSVVARAFTQWVTSELIFLLGLTVNLLKKNQKNYFTSARLHLIFCFQHCFFFFLSTISVQPERQAGEEGSSQTNQAQISLRRDICSETISQVVICGIIASPTHKCMGVCMRYASVSVCVRGIRWSQECPPNCLTGL